MSEILGGLQQLFKAFTEMFFNWISRVLSVVLKLLPDTPFKPIENSAVGDYLGYLNWIIPFDAIIVELELWTTAIIGFYLYMIFLRWLKAIQ